MPVDLPLDEHQEWIIKEQMHIVYAVLPYALSNQLKSHLMDPLLFFYFQILAEIWCLFNQLNPCFA